MYHYLYLLQRKFSVSPDEEEKIQKLIEQGELLKLLEDSMSDRYFEHPLVRQILLEAYPYEIELKFLQKDIKNNDPRNERLISLFNSYFSIDYHHEMQAYQHSLQASSLSIMKKIHTQ